ncbi:MAG TPA: hypothetical protein VFM25_14400, partial [Verrucomicrobiae bacterium]|nr:hypothetical protein [Verrucomicrobiae bacterium]
GATFTAENNASIIGGSGGVQSFFNNAGTFRKISSTGDTVFQQDASPAPAPVFVNTGLLDVQTGRVLLSGGTNFNQFNVEAGAQIRFLNGTNTQTGGAFFSGTGTLAVGSASPTPVLWLAKDLTLANLSVEGPAIVDGPGNLTVSNSLKLLAGGILQGNGDVNINPNASFIISNAPLVTLGRTINNQGNATNIGVGTVFAARPVAWNNQPGSVLALQGGANMDFNYSGAPPPVLNNAGTLAIVPTNNYTIYWIVTNIGTILVNPSSLTFQQSLTQIAGKTVVAAGSLLNVPTSFNRKFFVEGGTLSGSGEVDANVVNSGVIHPGASPGRLTIVGSLSNTPSASLEIEIDGTTPVSQYSQLNNVLNQDWLAGDLNVSFGNGFVPAAGQSFTICTSPSFSGVFSGVHETRTSGIVLVPAYRASSVVLVAANEPTLISPTRTGNVATFQFQSTTGITNLIQFTDSLSPPNWQPLTNFIGDGSILTVTDSSADSSQRFYRIELKP